MTRPQAFPLRGRWRAAPDEVSLVPRPAAAGYFAPRRERFICLRRGYFAPRRELLLSAVTKVAKSTGRNCVSALPQRAIPNSDFPRILAGIAFHHRCRSKGLRVRSPARRLTRPLAPATIGVFPPTAIPQSLPLEGKVPPKGADEVSPPQRRKRIICLRRGYFAPRRELLLSAVTKVAKSTA